MWFEHLKKRKLRREQRTKKKDVKESMKRTKEEKRKN